MTELITSHGHDTPKYLRIDEHIAKLVQVGAQVARSVRASIELTQVGRQNIDIVKYKTIHLRVILRSFAKANVEQISSIEWQLIILLNDEYLVIDCILRH